MRFRLVNENQYCTAIDIGVVYWCKLPHSCKEV